MPREPEVQEQVKNEVVDLIKDVFEDLRKEISTGKSTQDKFFDSIEHILTQRMNKFEEVRKEGRCIVVLSAGFVYLGELEILGDILHISNCFNIRTWGTQKGLGQLAVEGKTNETVLDACGDVWALVPELKHWIPIQPGAKI